VDRAAAVRYIIDMARGAIPEFDHALAEARLTELTLASLIEVSDGGTTFTRPWVDFAPPDASDSGPMYTPLNGKPRPLAEYLAEQQADAVMGAMTDV
jgi:hypothetical protein